jgi:hypothetical protein
MPNGQKGLYKAAFFGMNKREPATDQELADFVEEMAQLNAATPAPASRSLPSTSNMTQERLIKAIVEGGNAVRDGRTPRSPTITNKTIAAVVAGGNARRSEDGGR